MAMTLLVEAVSGTRSDPKTIQGNLVRDIQGVKHKGGMKIGFIIRRFSNEIREEVEAPEDVQYRVRRAASVIRANVVTRVCA